MYNEAVLGNGLGMRQEGKQVVLKEHIDNDRLLVEYNHFAEDIIKFCVDRKRRVVAIDREMHIEMEHELYDDSSDYSDIYGGNIVVEDGEVVDIEWEAHPNIERNRILHIGAGRVITDEKVIQELSEIINEWIG